MDHQTAKPTEVVEEAAQEAAEPHRLQKASAWKMLPVVLLVIVLAGLIVVGAVPRLVQQKALLDHQSKTDAAVPIFSVAVAQTNPAVEEFRLPGSTQAIQDAPVYARVNGYLRQRFADIGDHVAKGQVLAVIDTPELDKQVQTAENSVEQARASFENAEEALNKAHADEKTAAANVRKAKSDVEYAAIELKRYQLLASEGAVSVESRDQWMQNYRSGQAALDAASSALKSAQAAAKSSEAAVRVAESALHGAQSQREQYEATRSFRRVTALFDGTVTKRNVDAGALITAGSSSSNSLLFEIAKTDKLRIFVNVPEQYVPDIQVGQSAHLEFQAYPGQQFDGKVTNVAGGLETDSKTLQVEIQLDNSQHKLLPGMYAQVIFQVPARTRMAVIPASCLQTTAGGVFVYTVEPTSNRVKKDNVKIARDLGGFVEIYSGVKPADQVIISPSDEVHEGMSVKPLISKTAFHSST